MEGYSTKSSCRLLLLILSLFRFGHCARGCGGGGVGSHGCWLSVVTDEASNGGMVVVEGELELREASLKFRGPGMGDSEKSVEGGLISENREKCILSVS